ncbi:hypothetical protein [Halomonas sp. G11]|uniref:hypothetical protein n=1 Tax=Halomonas sp. G11 TaxID=1684425 RepID=UPI0007FE0520|nr:hypothetical protein [Halomonas sp. G11]OAZ99362.1 hypothetical protein ADS46_13875 [Halomonas sp. G11]
MHNFYRETVYIEKADGQRLGPLEAAVQKGKIIAPATHPIELGDVLVRVMDQSADERYIVDDPGYRPDSGLDFPAKYFVEVSKVGRDSGRTASSSENSSASNITVNVQGDHARVYSQSTDYSQNTINDAAVSKQLEALRSELQDRVEDPQRLDDFERQIDELEASHPNSATIGARLDSLIRQGAEYAEIIGKYKSIIMSLCTGGKES